MPIASPIATSIVTPITMNINGHSHSHGRTHKLTTHLEGAMVPALLAQPSGKHLCFVCSTQNPPQQRGPILKPNSGGEPRQFKSRSCFSAAIMAWRDASERLDEYPTPFLSQRKVFQCSGQNAPGRPPRQRSTFNAVKSTRPH